MKNNIVFQAITTVLFSIACQTLTPPSNGDNVSTPTQEIVSQPTATTIPTNVSTVEVPATDFLLILTPDASNITHNEDGSVSFLTNIPINGVEIFYQTAYSDRGLGRLHSPDLPEPAEGCLKMFFYGNQIDRPIFVSGCIIDQSGEVSITIGLEESVPSDVSTESEEAHTDFLLTGDAYKISQDEDGSVHFFTNMSFDEVEDFYRKELPLRGYTERIFDAPRPAEGCFRMIFDGDPSGKAMVVSGCIIFQTGEISVSIKLEDI